MVDYKGVAMGSIVIDKFIEGNFEVYTCKNCGLTKHILLKKERKNFYILYYYMCINCGRIKKIAKGYIKTTYERTMG